ncbi:MAG: cobalamin B12-binding domain-containing protein [Deltaproteobacteria bacterium]|nr:cobalamin B12-binding domain-containing protein [Deltaproteobacteria bacterium]
MRVLLISANTEKIPDPVYPIGAAAVGAAARRAGHDVEAVDLCFAEDARSLVLDAVRSFRPEVVGVSLRNLDNSAYPENCSYIDDYRALMSWLREISAAPVVLGGAGFTVMPATILEELHADYGVVGEGEEAFPWLLERIARGAGAAAGGGFSLQSVNGGALISAGARIKRLDAVPRPDRDLFDAPRYYDRGGCLNVQAKRGCCFDCVFCSYPLIEGAQVRTRSVAAVVDEIESLRERFGVRHLFFVDNIFNFPLPHAKRICEEIVRRGLDVEWSGYLNPKFVDEELVRLLAASGCKGVEFGTDSGAATMIANLRKEFDAEDLRRASRLCRRYGVKFAHSLIFGGPGETLETVEQTLALMDELNPTAVIAFTGIRVLPGTGMVEIALRDGQIDPDDNLLHPKFYISESLREDLIARIESHAARHSNWIVPGRGIKTNIQLLQRLRDKKIKGQLWRLLR